MAKMTKAEAGRLGGIATVKRHGASHMASIGRTGAERTKSLYNIVPLGINQYAMVSKETNQIKAVF